MSRRLDIFIFMPCKRCPPLRGRTKVKSKRVVTDSFFQYPYKSSCPLLNTCCATYSHPFLAFLYLYNYYEAVKEDVLNYIKEEVDMNGMDLDELKERLWEDLINNDSVTGNASGSYTSCRSEAEKYVEENKDLVREMCDEFGGHQRIANWWLTDDYELIDVSLRCYVLGNAIEMAVEELETAAE